MPRSAAPRLPIIQFLEHRPRAQRIALVVAAGLVIGWQLLRAGAQALLDRWWLDTVTDAAVWQRRTAAQLQLGVGSGALVALLLGGSVWLVLRTARLDHGRSHRTWQRYHERVGPAHTWALIAVAVYLTWHIGRAGAGEWQAWLLFRHGGNLGIDVPEIGGDLGFHLFRLPFLTTVSSFVRQLLLLTIALVGFGHLASGALRLPGAERRSSPVAVAHLTLLAVAFLATQATHEVVVARAATATNRSGAFDGPGFTELYATRPALLVAALLTVATGFSIVVGSRRGRWKLPVAVGIVAVIAHVVGLLVVPFVVDRYVVAPAEAARQLWAIEHNLDATRAAYALDAVPTAGADLHEGLTADEQATVAAGLSGSIPLFGTTQLASALQVQVGTAGTRIVDVDLAPYEIAGDARPVYTAARSASRADLPERGWVQEHLVYTHGDGVVAFAADVVDADGRPDVRSLPQLGGALHAPLYYGEGLEGWYAIAGTRRQEYDGAVYAGPGVSISSLPRRLALALAAGEAEPLLTSELTSDSVLLYRRGLRERVESIAPFLTLDSDPYAIVDGGRVTWVIDGYTTSSTYPYAQFMPAGRPPGTALAGGEQNYVRASVRVTIDAADGTVHLYRTDGGDDPIIDAWDEVFPGLFDDIADIPVGVADHLRYPADLFAVLTTMLGRYHVTDAEELFNGADRWAVSPAVATTVGGQPGGPAPSEDAFEDGRFSLTRTYGPGSSDNPTSSRDELAGLAIAAHGPSPGARLLAPTGETLLSPQVAQSAIDADPTLARDITLLNANGSHVEFGPMVPLVVGDGIAWARPITVIGTGTGSVPRLYGVAVVSDGLVGLGPTVADALAAIDRA